MPTELHPGDTFTLADLHLETPGLPFAALPAAVVDGADPQAITPTSVHTVTAPPGGTVEVRLASVSYSGAVLPLTSTPIGSGHIASIPVVAP